MKYTTLRWLPTVLLGLGALFTLGIDYHRSMPLRAPLNAVIPEELKGYHSRDLLLPDEERRVAGVSDYLLRAYAPVDSALMASGLTLYIGYYDQQGQGKTIHSPKNCLPGSGWKVLAFRAAQIRTAAGEETVNRYMLQRGGEAALVLYWYQGRGRVQANEYRVKWELLRDSALRGRSEEALVRIVVPIVEGEEEAFARAEAVAGTVIQALEQSLPS